MAAERPSEDVDSVELLRQGYTGDRAALEQLIERHHDWLCRYVRRRMGGDVRAKYASGDVVNDALWRLLEHGPRFVPRDEHEFRRFVGTIVVNRLHDLRRKHPALDVPLDALPTSIGPEARSSEGPERVVNQREEESLLRLSLELVEPEDAVVVQLRNDEELGFREIGERLGLSEDAARMRFNRALRRIGATMRGIETGQLDGQIAGQIDEPGDLEGPA